MRLFKRNILNKFISKKAKGNKPLEKSINTLVTVLNENYFKNKEELKHIIADADEIVDDFFILNLQGANRTFVLIQYSQLTEDELKYLNQKEIDLLEDEIIGFVEFIWIGNHNEYQTKIGNTTKKAQKFLKDKGYI